MTSLSDKLRFIGNSWVIESGRYSTDANKIKVFYLPLVAKNG